MEQKYKILRNQALKYGYKTLYRIQAIKDFDDVKKGDIGGFVEKESNLSQEGFCWIYDNAKVYDDAEIRDDAKVFDNVLVFEEAFV